MRTVVNRNIAEAHKNRGKILSLMMSALMVMGLTSCQDSTEPYLPTPLSIEFLDYDTEAPTSTVVLESKDYSIDSASGWVKIKNNSSCALKMARNTQQIGGLAYSVYAMPSYIPGDLIPAGGVHILDLGANIVNLPSGTHTGTYNIIGWENVNGATNGNNQIVKSLNVRIENNE